MPGGRPKGAKDKRQRKRRRDASPLPLDNSAASAAVRADVALYAGVGLTPEQIAGVLEIDVDIVRAQFAIELQPGNVIELARNVKRMRDAAEGGSVNAQKALDALLRPRTDGDRLHPMGKKATAAEAARAAAAGGNMFAPPAPPTGLGKKEFAALQAKDAERGTVWEDLLNPKPTEIN